MKNYYGLKLARAFYFVLSFVVAVATVGAVGYQLAQANFDTSIINWQQTMIYLIVGGLIALTSYVFSQLVDVSLQQYQQSTRIDVLEQYSARLYKM